MRRARITTGLLAFATTMLVLAQAAFASSPSGGQGWFGESNDTNITNAMFIVIVFFPTVITIFSIIQWRLEKRKHARMDAAKRRAASEDWRGGW
jgi:heme/copper-type cytochrome/quinol oxidase subunit 2